ncbi:hypothetical protein F5Y13DRAFT_204296 [Hypoxylon sp. FL1857]|nr:hypothetical protein F5Y13DRAFT_204296 [Hypoxylon sp. FL1857]
MPQENLQETAQEAEFFQPQVTSTAAQEANPIDLDWLLNCCEPDLSSQELNLQTPGLATVAPESTPYQIEDPLPQNVPYYPFFDSSVHISLQLLMTQIQSLTARIEALEASRQTTEKTIEEFTVWSDKMEKHSQEMNTTVLELFKMVQTPDVLRSILEDVSDNSKGGERGRE